LSHFLVVKAGEKLSQQQADTRAPGVEGLGAEKVNEVPELVYVHQTEVRCKKCGSPGAIIHLEEWSDGCTYSDYGCSACGYSEVLGYSE
jgi:predicted nucleic-acid-binding Zn-ribbon protein